jgi:ATP-dependent DNA helicase PIF1
MYSSTDFIAVTMPPRKRKAMSSVAELIDAVYPAVFQNYHNLNWLRERVILAAKNEDVHEIMNQILTMLPGVVTEYKSIDTIVDADEVVNFPLEFLNSLDPAGLPPHRLLLKVGSPIISLRNLDPPKLCNGTRCCWAM